MSGPSRQRFQPERAGATKQINYTRASQIKSVNGVGQNIENRFPGAVGRRAHMLSLRGFQIAPTMFAANDSHRLFFQGFGRSVLICRFSRSTLGGISTTPPRTRLPNWNGP